MFILIKMPYKYIFKVIYICKLFLNTVYFIFKAIEETYEQELHEAILLSKLSY
jgi:hypothetical protein